MAIPTGSVEEIKQGLKSTGYFAGDELATVVYLAVTMGRPLFVEGDPGVGKTELANSLATMAQSDLIRLQCYDGIDVAQAVYEWDYPRQLLHLRAMEATGQIGGDQNRSSKDGEDDKIDSALYDERFLIKRPLLRSLETAESGQTVLLIDEIDRADDEFEAFLLEVLADYSISIPELGTVRAAKPPVVVLTSNRTRDVHDALKRRCLYHWIDHPSLERETEIVTSRVDGIGVGLASEVAAGVGAARDMSLYKPPGISESIDWAQALVALGHKHIDIEAIENTIGAMLKYREDIEVARTDGFAPMIEAIAAIRQGPKVNG